MTILPTLALRSFVGFDNLFNELESILTKNKVLFLLMILLEYQMMSMKLH